jgi:hypothetical protein
MARCGGLRGAGGISTDAKIAANIVRGFGPKNRSAAAVPSARVRLWDYHAHSDLLCPSFAFVFVMAKDGEVAFPFQPCEGSSRGLSGAIIEAKWPTR